MNSNVTINALEYNLAYSDKTGSIRRNAGLGANLPRTLQIAHVATKDNKTKLAVRRSVIRHDRVVPDANGIPLATPVTVYLVAVVPDLGEAASVTNAINDGVVAIRQLISGTGADANALNLADAILKNQEQ